jgi:hypothetical protein
MRAERERGCMTRTSPFPMPSSPHLQEDTHTHTHNFPLPPPHLVCAHIVEQVDLLQVLAFLEQLLHSGAGVDRAADVLQADALQGRLQAAQQERKECCELRRDRWTLTRKHKFLSAS